MKDRRATSPVWKPPVADEVREELEFHFEMKVRELVASGLSEDQARVQASRARGELEALAKTCEQEARRRDRLFDLRHWFGELLTDLLFARRQLLRRPGFSAAVVLLLALGIAANVSVFSVFERLQLRELPFAEPHRLVTLWETHQRSGGKPNVVGPANFMEWREQAQTMENLAAFVATSANISGGAEPEQVAARLVTENYFPVLGRAAASGRAFLPEDYNQARSVTVLSYSMWKRRFASDPEIVGKDITVDERPTEVIGVMPADFELELGHAVPGLGSEGELWLPLPISERWREPRGRWLMVLARLRAGQTPAMAGEEMKALSVRLQEKFPDWNDGWGTLVQTLDEVVKVRSRTAATVLFVAIGLVWLIVCFNLSSLAAARGALRSGELTLRAALGASRWRLVRQLLTEGAFLALFGTVVGLFLAVATQQLINRWLPPELVPPPAPTGYGSLLAFSLALALLSTAMFALAPALAATTTATTVRSGGLGPNKHRLRTGLVVAELCVAVILLISAGLLIRSLDRLALVDPGFRAETATFRLSLPRGRSDDRIRDYYRQVTTRLEQLPELEAVAAVTHPPLTGRGAATSYFPLDRPEPAPADRSTADIRVVRGPYLEAIGGQLQEGRWFDDRDAAGAALGSIVVNETLARHAWPEGSAVGQRMFVSWGNGGARQIVGVVSDVRHVDLRTAAQDTIYFPHEQEVEGSMAILFRSSVDLQTAMSGVRRVLLEIDPSIPVFDVATLGERAARTLSNEDFLSRALIAFAAVALLLASIGTYSLTALATAQRTREFGLRLAIGASPRSLISLVVVQGLKLLVIGILAGLLGAIAAGRLLRSLLFEVRPSDPLTILIVVAMLTVSSVLAVLLPARRAARLSALEAMRE